MICAKQEATKGIWAVGRTPNVGHITGKPHLVQWYKSICHSTFSKNTGKALPTLGFLLIKAGDPKIQVINFELQTSVPD